jgi:hypothetical protein
VVVVDSPKTANLALFQSLVRINIGKQKNFVNYIKKKAVLWKISTAISNSLERISTRPLPTVRVAAGSLE